MAKPDKEKNDNSKLKDKIDSTILESRRIFLSDAIDNDTSADVVRKLWYLELTSPGTPITFIINSPGGSVDAGFAIWDQITMITSPVTTIVTGLAASMASIISLCAAPKKRYATPNARFMIHQPLIGGVIKGQATDLDIQAKELLKTRAALVNIYVQKTGKDAATIERAIDRDTWLTPEEAKSFGLIDEIITSYSNI